MKEKKKIWKFSKKLTRMLNKGKDFLRAIKFSEKEILFHKIILKKNHFKNIFKIIENFKKKGFQKKKIEKLEMKFHCQKKTGLKKLNILNFSLDYYTACRNRFSQFFRFSNITIRKKDKEFFSGFVNGKKNKTVKTFLVKKILEQKERALIWRLICLFKSPN